MTAWLLSIVGIVALGVLLEILLDEGETAKYIKGVFAIAVVLVIVAPLPKLFNSDWTFDELFGANEYEINGAFVDNIESSRLEELERFVLKELLDMELDVERVRIFNKPSTTVIDVVKVYVPIGVAEDSIVNAVMQILAVSAEEVRIYYGEG